MHNNVVHQFICSVIPAKAGIQHNRCSLDSCLRRNDEYLTIGGIFEVLNLAVYKKRGMYEFIRS
ncbi:MAG: hypothetical protein EAZ74_03455 [Alphaproteobacteria bacterium]|nr:MAG: hypothetical protein EAZ74_03455 [Alphaproteobacteria bacterium]